LRIAAIFREKGYINESNDIFFFTHSEISTIIEKGVMPNELKSLYLKRKSEVKQYQNIQLPNIIIGDHLPLTAKYTDVADRLNGIGTSKGQTEGNVKVIRGMDDFVIPYSDISWTPLFIKAKAIIAESGGMLSHSSIVAREYGIPAVVSVEGALNLKDGTQVLVDGYQGEVIIKN